MDNKFISRLAVSALCGALLTACAGYQTSYPPTAFRNQITVSETVERLEMYVGPAGYHLSPRDQDAVNGFVSGYAANGSGPLYMNLPRGAAGSGIADAQSAIVQRLRVLGIAPGALQRGQYAAAPGRIAPVVISYRRLAAVPADCPPGRLTETSTNQPREGFGCSQNANLAALIDNPRHLLSPYDFAPPPADRNVRVLTDHINKAPTGTPRPAGQEISATGG